ncbi:MAG: hypothetical protein RL748_419 [Pseudomonadota bacterium]|jgi:predicted transposase/invertase (TIGR01784 family)
MTGSSDTDYKAIFSHPEMVIDVLTGFVPGSWLEDLDFATLEPCKSSFITDHQASGERHSDLIWRVRCKDNWLYLYLLFEFQSTINHFMAIRMLVYVGLLYQELIKNKEYGPNQKLPFVLPIVLYNGTPRWNAALSTQDLITPPPPGFEPFLPQMAYRLLDEGSYDETELEALENLAAAIFLIENQTSPEGLHKALNRVLKWQNAGKQQSLSTAIAKLAHRVLHKRMPNMPMPEGINDLKGVVSMLSENIENMVLESSRKAKQEGKLEGEAIMFKAMLASRFGPVPSWVTDKINSATSEQLMIWGARLFTAADLTDLFGAR